MDRPECGGFEMRIDNSNDFGGDAKDLAKELLEFTFEVIDTRPDGRPVIVTGDVDRCRDFCELQGQNDLGFLGTCGLCAAKDVLNQFFKDVKENDVVKYAADHGLCTTNDTDPAMNGGTTPSDQAQILIDFGVPAHVEGGATLDDLAQFVEEGRGIIIGVDAGVLWGDFDSCSFYYPNHGITVTGVMRDLTNSNVIGYYVNDSGTGTGAQYVSIEKMEMMWSAVNGSCVITDVLK